MTYVSEFSLISDQSKSQTSSVFNATVGGGRACFPAPCLFETVGDPAEASDLAAARPALLAHLLGVLRREHATGRWRAQKPEEVSLERSGYDTARRAHEERLTRIFTPRPHSEFAKTKGNIPEYGNFSNYGAFMVRQTGKTF